MSGFFVVVVDLMFSHQANPLALVSVANTGGAPVAWIVPNEFVEWKGRYVRAGRDPSVLRE